MGTAIRTEGSPPCRVGQKILLGPTGALAGTLGCAEFDDAAIADAPGVLAEGRPSTRTYPHELGTVEVFLEPFVRSSCCREQRTNARHHVSGLLSDLESKDAETVATIKELIETRVRSVFGNCCARDERTPASSLLA